MMTANRPLVLFLGLVLLGACNQRPPPELYVLAPLPSVPQTTRPGSVIGVAQIALPGYLDRKEIVSRNGNRLILGQDDHWGEALDRNIQRVLAADIATLLGSDRIVELPARGRGAVDYEVSVEIGAFEQDADGSALLAARWSILDGERGSVVASGGKIYREPLAGPGYGSLVAALNRSLEALSRDIAPAIDRLPVSRQGRM